MKLLDLLRHVGKKPGFYLGDPPARSTTIWHLHSFLVGYQCASHHHSAEDDELLDCLTPWVCTRYGVADGPMDWAGHLWRQSGEDGEAAFRLFFELFEEYVRDRDRLGKAGIEARFAAMLKQKGLMRD